MTLNQQKNQKESALKYGYKLLKYNKSKGYWGNCNPSKINENDYIRIEPFPGLKLEADDLGKGVVEKVFDSDDIMLVKFESMKYPIMCHSTEYITMHDSANVKYLYIAN